MNALFDAVERDGQVPYLAPHGAVRCLATDSRTHGRPCIFQGQSSVNCRFLVKTCHIQRWSSRWRSSARFLEARHEHTYYDSPLSNNLPPPVPSFTPCSPPLSRVPFPTARPTLPWLRLLLLLPARASSTGG